MCSCLSPCGRWRRKTRIEPAETSRFVVHDPALKGTTRSPETENDDSSRSHEVGVSLNLNVFGSSVKGRIKVVAGQNPGSVYGPWGPNTGGGGSAQPQSGTWSSLQQTHHLQDESKGSDS